MSYPDHEHESGAFIQGGYRPSPIVLPPIEDVMPGTFYQDETGAIWKAVTPGRAAGYWLQMETVTAHEHAALKRRKYIYLGMTVLAGLAGWLLLSVGLFTELPSPWDVFAPLVAVVAIGGSFWAWHLATYRLARQLVVPAPGDID